MVWTETSRQNLIFTIKLTGKLSKKEPFYFKIAAGFGKMY
jgi:hypothetical protein